MNFNDLEFQLLEAVTNIQGLPSGAANIRRDGKAVLRQSSPNIIITSKIDNPGLNVEIKPGTKNESVHVPVILTQAGFKEKVYNTFIVGEEADITIIAGCGIHNDSHQESRHEGIHEIIVKTGAHLKYVEKHYGQGRGEGKRVFTPYTRVIVESGASCEMEMVQIRGVDDTVRNTTAHVGKSGILKIIERLLTEGEQFAESNIDIIIEGKNGAAQILSRSVAQDNSRQIFKATLNGKTECTGHVECDSIIMNNSQIRSVPELVAEDAGAVLTHEAAIGKIAGEQLIKLMSLGLTEKEAVDTIINGFLR